MDKLCSFVEIYFLTEKNFYSFTETLKETKKIKAIFTQLETDREYNLNLKIVNNPVVILILLKIYFNKYLRSNQEDVK